MSDEEKKSSPIDEALKSVFILSLKVGIEYGKEILKENEGSTDDLNKTLRELLSIQ